MKTIPRRIIQILAGLALAALAAHLTLWTLSEIALRDAYQQLRASGRPMSPEEIIPPQVPVADNAAPLYASAFALLESETADGKTLFNQLGDAARDYSADQPDSDEKRAAFEPLLSNETVAQALALVEEASARPHCNFDLPYQQGTLLRVPHVNGFLKITRALSAKALWEAQRGNGAAAWRIQETQLRVADALRTEPVLISALVRISQYKTALASIRNIHQRTPLDAETAARLTALLATGDDVGPYALALDGERLVFGEWAFEWIHTHNLYEFTPPMKEFNCIRWLMERYPNYVPARQADHAFYLRALGQVADAASLNLWDPLPRGPVALDQHIPWYATISRIVLPALSQSRIRMVQLQANVRVMRAGLALLRHKDAHGAYPATLAEIDPSFLAETPRDPFTGQPLVYRPEADGFVLYSLGENLQDDDGTEETKDSYESKAFDIVWRTEH